MELAGGNRENPETELAAEASEDAEIGSRIGV